MQGAALLPSHQLQQQLGSNHVGQRGEGIKWGKTDREGFSVKREVGWRRKVRKEGETLGEGSEGGMGRWCMYIERRMENGMEIWER